MIFFVALRKELLEQWRSHRLLVVAVVLVAFGLSSPLLARFTPEILALLPEGEQFSALVPSPTVADAVGQYLKNLSQFAVLLALLMAMGSVAQERDKGTAALMLVKPLPRWAFLGAKFVALGVTFLIATLLAAVAGYYYTLVLFEPLHLLRWLALNGLFLLFVLVYLALTLLCSTATRSQVTAGGLAFSAVILLSLLGSIPRLGDWLPGRLLSWGGDLALGGSATAWGAVGVSLGLIVAALIGAWAIFRRQEL